MDEKAQEKAARDLERLKNGEASLNDIRRENGMEPMTEEGADERYRATGIEEIRIPLKIDVRPAKATASKLREIAKIAQLLSGLIDEMDQGFKVDVDFPEGGEGMEEEKKAMTRIERIAATNRILYEQLEHLAALAKMASMTEASSQESITRAMCAISVELRVPSC